MAALEDTLAHVGRTLLAKSLSEPDEQVQPVQPVDGGAAEPASAAEPTSAAEEADGDEFLLGHNPARDEAIALDFNLNLAFGLDLDASMDHASLFDAQEEEKQGGAGDEGEAEDELWIAEDGDGPEGAEGEANQQQHDALKLPPPVKSDSVWRCSCRPTGCMHRFSAKGAMLFRPDTRLFCPKGARCKLRSRPG